jgi:hypothetical protein
VAGSGAAAYTTRMQRAARWHQEDDDYASPAQAITNAQRALKAAGYNAHAWQTRQIIAWRQGTTGNTHSTHSLCQGPEGKARQGLTTQDSVLRNNTWLNGSPMLWSCQWEVRLWLLPQQLGYKAQEVTPSSQPHHAT